MKNEKIVEKVEGLKPRNHVLIAMSKRGGAGSHEKPHKSQRQQEKVLLKKQIKF